MMQKFIFGAMTLFCLVLAIFGFTNKNGYIHSNVSTIKSTNTLSIKTTENVTMVFPNPETGILNLHCNSDLISPISVKAFNANGDVVKSINSLIVEGTSSFKYLQMSISGLEKGKYSIAITDLKGKTSTRNIYINK